MAALYDTQAFLLDRANVYDVVTRLTMNIDLGLWDELADEVYASQVVVDYTSMFGGKPMEMTNQGYVENLRPTMTGFDSIHHIVMGQVIQLPQPVPGVARPDKCTVIANVVGHMTRHGAKGGPMMHNGGRYVLDLVRLPELERKGQNPWRISRHATELLWQEGSSDVMTQVATLGS
ncbi:hypothetical protein GGR52DRAFT_551736 [Hypoxylon sp. FL1284]|nr:hypothetical protein GGR52DRAFT_551736 [Hypoxylon sp. FL1284]